LCYITIKLFCIKYINCFVQIVELREALNIQNSWSHSPENINNIDTLIQIWHNRNPWIGDSLNVWSDLISWRQTYYSFLNQRNLNLKTHFIKSAQVIICKYSLISNSNHF